MEVDAQQRLPALKGRKEPILRETPLLHMHTYSSVTKTIDVKTLQFPMANEQLETNKIHTINDITGPFYQMLTGITRDFALETCRITCKRDQLYERLQTLRQHWDAGTFPSHIKSRSSSATAPKELKEQLELFTRQQLLLSEIKGVTSKYDELNDMIMSSYQTLIHRMIKRIAHGSFDPPSHVIFCETWKNPFVRLWFESYQTTLMKFRDTQEKNLQKKIRERQKHVKLLEEKKAEREQQAAATILKPTAQLQQEGKSIDPVEVLNLQDQLKALQLEVRRLKATSSGNVKAGRKSSPPPKTGNQQRQGENPRHQKQKPKQKPQGKQKKQTEKQQRPNKQKPKIKPAEN